MITTSTASSAGGREAGAEILPIAPAPPIAPIAPAAPIACTLIGDGGNMLERLGDWQAALERSTGREEIPEGVAVTFGHDVDRTAELARLLAAEYACCSFASYHLSIDGHGVRIEVHAPPEARGSFAALFGVAATPGAV